MAKRLYLVHVTTTLEDGFEAGCWVAIEASDPETARNLAYDEEANAVGSDDADSDRKTTVEDCHLVPRKAETFIREVFGVTKGG